MVEVGRLYRSSPKRCNGVLKSCIPAGAKNCATLARLMPIDCSSDKIGSKGAIRGGRLKEANTVSESRSAKSA